MSTCAICSPEGSGSGGTGYRRRPTASPVRGQNQTQSVKPDCTAKGLPCKRKSPDPGEKLAFPGEIRGFSLCAERTAGREDPRRTGADRVIHFRAASASFTPSTCPFGTFPARKSTPSSPAGRQRHSRRQRLRPRVAAAPFMPADARVRRIASRCAAWRGPR